MVLATFISHAKHIMWTMILWYSLSFQIFCSILGNLTRPLLTFLLDVQWQRQWQNKKNQAVSLLRQSPASHHGGSVSCQSMWDLWWSKWHWDRFSSKYFFMIAHKGILFSTRVGWCNIYNKMHSMNNKKHVGVFNVIL